MLSKCKYYCWVPGAEIVAIRADKTMFHKLLLRRENDLWKQFVNNENSCFPIAHSIDMILLGVFFVLWIWYEDGDVKVHEFIETIIAYKIRIINLNGLHQSRSCWKSRAIYKCIDEMISRFRFRWLMILISLCTFSADANKLRSESRTCP